MPVKNTPLLLLNTCPNTATAKNIAQKLLTEQRASCVNIIPEIHSCFNWDGKIKNEKECLLLIKTMAKNYPKLEQFICSIHPYQLPEIIAIPIEIGLAAYLDWVKTNTKK